MADDTTPPHFLTEPEVTPEARRLFDEDVEDVGYVMNLSRLWAYGPAMKEGMFGVLGAANKMAGLTYRQRGILISALASTMCDSYCSLAWGTRLAEAADPEVAAAVLRSDDSLLDEEERALAVWARKVTDSPSDIDEHDIATLREAGFGDEQIFALTVFVAIRIAFSTVNDALGARPDGAYLIKAPQPVLAAVAYGRPIGP